MASKLQRILYILGGLCPALAVSCFVYLLVNREANIFVIVILAISIAIEIYSLYFPKLMKDKCGVSPINPVKTPAVYDDISYSICLNLFSCLGGYFLISREYWIILFVSVVIMVCSNKNYGNILYPLIGYHYFNVETDTGRVDLMISRKSYYRNKDDVKLAIRIFDGLLMDVS